MLIQTKLMTHEGIRQELKITAQPRWWQLTMSKQVSSIISKKWVAKIHVYERKLFYALLSLLPDHTLAF